MGWCDILGVLAVFFIIIQLIRLVVADGDLMLMWKARYGCKPDKLKGKVVWITGASSGIGEHLAYELAKVGCRLTLSARRTEELERVKKQCLVCGPVQDSDVLVMPLDLSDLSSHQGAVDMVIKHFNQIDILVNNGGRSQRAMIHETSLEVDQEMIQLNVMGQVSLTKAVLPHMRKRKSGHVVVTSSIAGKMGVPFSATYCLTKFALHGWFESLRVEGAEDNIDVTMVCPGPVFSDLTRVCFTGEKGKIHGKPMGTKEKRVSTQRCAELMAVGIANKLGEVWIALQPVLAFAYLGQYAPGLGKFLAVKMGMKTITRLREGQ